MNANDAKGPAWIPNILNLLAVVVAILAALYTIVNPLYGRLDAVETRMTTAITESEGRTAQAINALRADVSDRMNGIDARLTSIEQYLRPSATGDGASVAGASVAAR